MRQGKSGRSTSIRLDCLALSFLPARDPGYNPDMNLEPGWSIFMYRRRMCVIAMCLQIAGAACAADVQTIAGNGRQTYSGDDGAALEAGIGEPFGLAFGPDGALYVCSVTNHCVRRIDERTGLISTVA